MFEKRVKTRTEKALSSFGCYSLWGALWSLRSSFLSLTHQPLFPLPVVFSEGLQGLHSFVSMDFLSPTFGFHFKGSGYLFKPVNLLTAFTIFFTKMCQ